MVTKSSIFNICIRNLSLNTFLIPKLFSIFRRNEKLSRLETMNKEQRSPLVFINSLLSHSLSLSLSTYMYSHTCTSQSFKSQGNQGNVYGLRITCSKTDTRTTSLHFEAYSLKNSYHKLQCSPSGANINPRNVTRLV